MSTAIKVRNAYTMMVGVEVDERENVLRVRFADDARGELPWGRIRADAELDPNDIRLDTPYELRIGYKDRAGHVNLPWDYVRPFCDPDFEATEGAFAEQTGRRLGKRIRRYRKALGWTQEQLARAAGISRVNLSRIECGKGTSPTFATLQRIAAALKVDAFDLVDVENEMS